MKHGADSNQAGQELVIVEDLYRMTVSSFGESHLSSISSLFELSRSTFQSGNTDYALDLAEKGLNICLDSHGPYCTQYLDGLQTISQMFIDSGK